MNRIGFLYSYNAVSSVACPVEIRANTHVYLARKQTWTILLFWVDKDKRMLPLESSAILDQFVYDYTGWPKKVSHCQMMKKSYYILLKRVNEIRFIRQIKVWI